MTKLTCKICKRNFNMLAGDICAYCDFKHWTAYFEKFKGKGANK